MTSQLSLALTLRDDATFDNFLAQPGSPRFQVAGLLRERSGQDDLYAYLWGAPGSGISHLLQASCHHELATGGSAQYLPLGELAGYDGDQILEGLEQLSLVCIQGVEAIQGDNGWELALFALFNRMKDGSRRLIVSADRPPRALNLNLPDLQSRLSSGLTYHLPPYSDEDKARILRFRASRLGLDMGEEVATFIVNRVSREPDQLMACLQRLDAASLQAQRRLTIPFVKEVFSW